MTDQSAGKHPRAPRSLLFLAAISAFMVGPCETSGGTDLYDALNACTKYQDADHCERAYVAVTEAKSQLRVGLGVASLDPRTFSIIAKSVGVESKEILGQRLSPDELLMLLTYEQFATAWLAAADQVLRSSERGPMLLYSGQAYRAGQSVLQNSLASPIAQTMKGDVSKHWQDVKDVYELAQKPRSH